jgi:hypothetical protein
LAVCGAHCSRHGPCRVVARLLTPSYRGEGLAVSGIYLALAIDGNAHSEFEATARHAEQACADDHELGYATWALPELIEGAVRAGQIATAPVALTRLQRLGNAQEVTDQCRFRKLDDAAQPCWSGSRSKAKYQSSEGSRPVISVSLSVMFLPSQLSSSAAATSRDM